MTRFATTATIALVLVAVVGMLGSSRALAVRVVREDGQVLACSRTTPGTIVILSFTHSMYGGDVTETWLVQGDRLDRIGIETDNAAAAEYYAWDGQMVRSGDRFAVITPPLREDTLVVRVDQIGQHRLAIGPDRFDLAAMVGTTAQVRIEPVSAPAWQGSPC